MTVWSEERRNAHERVGQGRFREEVAKNRKDFVQEKKLAGNVRGATDRQDRAVRQGEGQARQGLGKKGVERGNFAQLQQHTCAARVCNQR